MWKCWLGKHGSSRTLQLHITWALSNSGAKVGDTFNQKCIPQYVAVGCTRYFVSDYVETPWQCRTCQRFKHVAELSKFSILFSKCDDSHDPSSCSAEKLK